MHREDDLTAGRLQQLLAAQQTAQAPFKTTEVDFGAIKRGDMRFQAAVAAMQGLCANLRSTPKSLAEEALRYADALLAALDGSTK